MRQDHQAANDSPYWPACVREPGFLPWLARFMAIVNTTRPDTPIDTLGNMARKHGHVPPEWVLSVLFLMEHARADRCTSG